MSAWQPIETAPKDKDILFNDRRGTSVHEGKWMTGVMLQYSFGFKPEDGWYWAGYGPKPVGPMFPSHWMPVPTSPVNSTVPHD